MKTRFLRAASWFVCFSFTFTSLNPVSFAMTPEVSSVPFKALTIPAEFGQVTDMFAGSPGAPALIHIQSAHGNFSAEKNIENLLGYVEKKSNVHLMLLEGAASQLKPELFRMFPKHPAFSRQVTDKLMQEGYLTGPESFLVETAKKTEGWGIEDLSAYKKDREAFMTVVKADSKTQSYLLKRRAELSKQFASKLGKDLLTFVRQGEAFDTSALSFEAWLKVLAENAAKNLRLDLASAFNQVEWPFLVRYERLHAIGSKIDSKKARTEARSFLKELEKRKVSREILASFEIILSTPEAELFKTMGKSAEGYSSVRLAFDRAFSKLPKDFSMKAWPNWSLYAQYAILTQELESKGLHEEMTRLQDKIFDALAKTDDEQAYVAQSRELNLLRKLFALELNREEYEKLNIQRDSFLASRDSKEQNQSLVPSSELRELFAAAMDFYATAVVREHKMFENALAKMAEKKEKRAVIVTGGFHAEGLKKLAALQGCAYMQITPRIDEITKRDHEIYLRSIFGSRDFETSQMGRALFLNFAAMKEFLAKQLGAVKGLVRGKISGQPVLEQPALTSEFDGSLLFGARSEVRQLKRSEFNYNEYGIEIHDPKLTQKAGEEQMAALEEILEDVDGNTIQSRQAMFDVAQRVSEYSLSARQALSAKVLASRRELGSGVSQSEKNQINVLAEQYRLLIRPDSFFMQETKTVPSRSEARDADVVMGKEFYDAIMAATGKDSLRQKPVAFSGRPEGAKDIAFALVQEHGAHRIVANSWWAATRRHAFEEGLTERVSEESVREFFKSFRYKVQTSVYDIYPEDADLAEQKEVVDFFVEIFKEVEAAKKAEQQEAKQDALQIYAQHFSLKSGAATGSVSSHLVEEVGAQASLTGHSERRTRLIEIYDMDKNSPKFGKLLRTEQQYGDSDDAINQKLKAAARGEVVKQLLCMGEPRSVREQGDDAAIAFVLDQLAKAFKDMSEQDIRNALKDNRIAYEPIWAINTGLTASPAQAQTMHHAIRQWLEKTYSPELAREMTILYGGSAKPDNVEKLLSQPDIDGFLVGGASLKLESFSRMGQLMAGIGDKGNGRKPILAANWKAEPSAKRTEINEFVSGLAQEPFLKEGKVGIIIAPPHTLIERAVQARDGAARSELRTAVLPQEDPAQTSAWKQLRVLAKEMKAKANTLRELFSKDPERVSKLTMELREDVAFDFSKQRVTEQVLDTLVKLAEQTGVPESIQKMFEGAKINETEDRAALHVALRNVKRDPGTGKLVAANGPILVDGQDVMPGVIQVLEQMERFVDAIHSGKRVGYTKSKIKNIVNIGIGGSDLGGKMATRALTPYQFKRKDGVNVYYVSNVDGTDLAEVVKNLDPEETMFVIASKTFTTAETMQNARSAKDWILRYYGVEATDQKKADEVVNAHFIALSTASKLVQEFGITPDADHMFPFWDWVGGRYSVWSAIGLPLATYIGFDNFLKFLEGARYADEHFKNTPLRKNIPVVKALLNIWNGNFLGARSFAVLPYDQYLSLFPEFAQQFFMESNGKITNRLGRFIRYITGLILWGAAGTNGQHSFYQLIHQGTHLIPADFIGVLKTHNPLPGHHAELFSNVPAQTEALAFGASKEEVKELLAKDSKYEGKDIDWHAAQQTFPGNKPTTTIMLDEVSPETLGMLIATYEHQIFVESVVLNIFAFDQWGVQLGKKVALKVHAFLTGKRPPEEIASAGISASGAWAINKWLTRGGGSQAGIESQGGAVSKRSELRAEVLPEAKWLEVAQAEAQIKRAFGTNGIRADDIGIDGQRRIAAGTADVLAAEWRATNPGKELPWVMVGFDPRPQGDNGFTPGEMSESKAVAEVFAAYGFKVLFVPKAVAAPFMISASGKNVHPKDIYAAVMRTASHNEVVDPKSGKLVSGFKLFMENAPAADSFTGRISAKINDAEFSKEVPVLNFDQAVQEGRIVVSKDGDKDDPDTVEFQRMQKAFDLKAIGKKILAKFPGFKIALNTMNGGMSSFGPRVLKAMGIVNNEHGFLAFNTKLMNDPSMKSKMTGWREYQVSSTGETKKVRFAPDPTRVWMRGKEYQDFVAQDPMKTLALLIDGDADRLVAELGKEIIPNEIGMLAAYYLAKYKGQKGRIVRTVPTTGGLDALAQALELGKVDVTPVGSKWFKGPNQYFDGSLTDVLVAVEESGHIVFNKNGELFFDHSIGLATLMLEMMAETGKTWQELSDEMWAFIKEKTGQERIATVRGGIAKDEGAENYYPLLLRLGNPAENAFRHEFATKMEATLAKAGLPWKVVNMDITDAGGAQLQFEGGRKVFPRKSGTDGSVRLYVEVLEAERDHVPFLAKSMREVMDDVLASRSEVRKAYSATAALGLSGIGANLAQSSGTAWQPSFLQMGARISEMTKQGQIPTVHNGIPSASWQQARSVFGGKSANSGAVSSKRSEVREVVLEKTDHIPGFRDVPRGQLFLGKYVKLYPLALQFFRLYGGKGKDQEYAIARQTGKLLEDTTVVIGDTKDPYYDLDLTAKKVVLNRDFVDFLNRTGRKKIFMAYLASAVQKVHAGKADLDTQELEILLAASKQSLVLKHFGGKPKTRLDDVKALYDLENKVLANDEPTVMQRYFLQDKDIQLVIADILLSGKTLDAGRLKRMLEKSYGHYGEITEAKAGELLEAFHKSHGNIMTVAQVVTSANIEKLKAKVAAGAQIQGDLTAALEEMTPTTSIYGLKKEYVTDPAFKGRNLIWDVEVERQDEVNFGGKSAQTGELMFAEHAVTLPNFFSHGELFQNIFAANNLRRDYIPALRANIERLRAYQQAHADRLKTPLSKLDEAAHKILSDELRVFRVLLEEDEEAGAPYAQIDQSIRVAEKLIEDMEQFPGTTLKEFFEVFGKRMDEKAHELASRKKVYEAEQAKLQDELDKLQKEANKLGAFTSAETANKIKDLRQQIEKLTPLIEAVDLEEKDFTTAEAERFLVASRNFVLSDEIVSEMKDYLHQLAERLGIDVKDLVLAIRSSGVGEDGETASFAGRQDTYIFVTPGKPTANDPDGLNAMVESWIFNQASLFNKRAISYRFKHALPTFDAHAEISTLFQEMFLSTISFIAFSVDRATGFGAHSVQAMEGQGEKLVSGQESGSQFVITHDGRRLNASIGIRKIKVVPTSDGKRKVSVPLTKEEAAEFVITDHKLLEESARYFTAIHEFYGGSKLGGFMDLEGAWRAKTDEHGNPIYLTDPETGKVLKDERGNPRLDWTIVSTQARPETVISMQNPDIVKLRRIVVTDEAFKKAEKAGKVLNFEFIAKTGGTAQGEVTFIFNKRDPKELAKAQGKIMVTLQSDPDMESAMTSAKGIIAIKGGQNSHTMIVATEFGLIAITGTKEELLKALKEGDKMTLDAERGKVIMGYDHDLRIAGNDFNVQKIKNTDPGAIRSATIAATINKAMESSALSKIPSDEGIGLTRLELVLKQIGIYPDLLMAYDNYMAKKEGRPYDLNGPILDPKIAQDRKDIKLVKEWIHGFNSGEDFYTSILSEFVRAMSETLKAPMEEVLLRAQKIENNQVRAQAVKIVRDYYAANKFGDLEPLKKLTALENELSNGATEDLRNLKDTVRLLNKWLKIRLDDRKSDEYEGIPGATRFVKKEGNPMKGLRGLELLLSTPTLRWQLRAIAKIAHEGHGKLGVFAPVVRRPSAVRKLLEIMDEEGLTKNVAKRGIMTEIPINALDIDKFLETGIDFISTGGNDGEQTTNRKDRNASDGFLAKMGGDFSKAALRWNAVVGQAVKKYNKKHGTHIEAGFCGNAPSVKGQDDYAIFLREVGYNSVSVIVEQYEKVTDKLVQPDSAARPGLLDEAAFQLEIDPSALASTVKASVVKIEDLRLGIGFHHRLLLDQAHGKLGDTFKKMKATRQEKSEILFAVDEFIHKQGINPNGAGAGRKAYKAYMAKKLLEAFKQAQKNGQTLLIATDDAPSNLYRALLGGRFYEPKEANPDFGVRGFVKASNHDAAFTGWDLEVLAELMKPFSKIHAQYLRAARKDAMPSNGEEESESLKAPGGLAFLLRGVQDSFNGDVKPEINRFTQMLQKVGLEEVPFGVDFTVAGNLFETKEIIEAGAKFLAVSDPRQLASETLTKEEENINDHPLTLEEVSEGVETAFQILNTAAAKHNIPLHIGEWVAFQTPSIVSAQSAAGDLEGLISEVGETQSGKRLIKKFLKAATKAGLLTLSEQSLRVAAKVDDDGQPVSSKRSEVRFEMGRAPSKFGPAVSQEGLKPLFERIAWARKNAPAYTKIKKIYAFSDQKHGMDPKEAISFGVVLEGNTSADGDDVLVVNQNASVMGGISAGVLEPGTHDSIAKAIQFFNEHVAGQLAGLNVSRPDEITAKILEIDETFRNLARRNDLSDKGDKQRFSYIGAEISIGVSMAATFALAEALNVPTEVVLNYRYNEYAMTTGLANEPRPMSIPVNYSVVWEGGKHGVAKYLHELVEQGIIKNDSLFPERFKDQKLIAKKDKSILLAAVPPQELQVMVLAPEWEQARQIGIKLTKLYQAKLKEHGIKTKYGAESGFTTEQLRDKNGNLIDLDLVLDVLEEAVAQLPANEAKYVRYALDIAASEMYIPEIDMYYVGPSAAKNDDGLVTNEGFTQYKLALFKKYGRFLSVEDWANEDSIDHWEDAKAIMGSMIQMGDDNTVSRADMIRKFKAVMNAHLQKPNQSAEEQAGIEAVATSHNLGNVVVSSHRGTRAAQEIYTALAAIGMGTFGAKWTLWGPGRGALIAAMTQANTLYNQSGAFQNVKLPYQGALVLDPKGPYANYGWAQRVREEIAADEARPVVRLSNSNFKPVNVPKGLVPAVEHYGLKPTKVEVLNLSGEAVPADLLSDKLASFAVGSSIAQAFGSQPFTGLGKDVKEVADGNAVHFTERSLEYFTKQNAKTAVVVLGDEGARDGSFSLAIGTLYVDGKKMSLESKSHLYEMLKDLRDEGYQILYFVGDALEHTNGLYRPEALKAPSDSNSLFSFFIDGPGAHLDGKNRFFISDFSRIGGTSFSSPTSVAVSPFDLPSVALPKIAKARGEDLATFMNRSIIVTLGPRASEDRKAYETSLSKHRHQAIIKDMSELKTKYPGLTVVTPGDGDLLPRIVSLLGLDLDGKLMDVFGRSGAAEATAATIVATSLKDARFSHTFVSPKATGNNFSAATAYQYSEAEVESFKELGIPADVYNQPRGKKDVKGKGMAAFTSVTGASEGLFGKAFSSVFQRLTFKALDGKKGQAVTNTLFVKDGAAFIVRTTLNTEDMPSTQKELSWASHPAREYWRAQEGSTGAARSELRREPELPKAPVVSFSETLGRLGVSIKGVTGTAKNVTGGLYARSILAVASARTALLELANAKDNAGELAKKSMDTAMMLLGLRPTAHNDVFVLGTQFFLRDPRAAAGMRKLYGQATLMAIVTTPTELQLLEDLNKHFAKEGLQPIVAVDARDIASFRTRLSHIKNAVVRPVLLGGEVLPEGLQKLLAKNQMIVTDRMFNGFVAAVDMLVAGLVGDLQARFAMARSA